LVPLLEAVAMVRTERDEVHLVVIGKPKDGSKVPGILDRLALTQHVTFVSGVPTERIVELYAECELAVVPSLYEGFSLPAIEAMSCGAPLVTTTGGALPEVTGPSGTTALTVPPNDPEALAGAIRTMLDDAELRSRLGAAGRDRVLDRFTWRRTAHGMIENGTHCSTSTRGRTARSPFRPSRPATRGPYPRHGLRRWPPRVRRDEARRPSRRARLLGGRAEGRPRDRRRDARGW
jgi:hypothetical protein